MRGTMLKKPAGLVLASFGAFHRTAQGTIRLFTRCGLASDLVDQSCRRRAVDRVCHDVIALGS
jgi:hypothetical protein